MPFIFSTTLLLYKLDTLLLKQKNCRHPSTHAENETCYIQYGPLLFVSIVLYLINKGVHCLGFNWIVLLNYSNQKFPLQGFFNRLLGTTPITLYNRNT